MVRLGGLGRLVVWNSFLVVPLRPKNPKNPNPNPGFIFEDPFRIQTTNHQFTIIVESFEAGGISGGCRFVLGTRFRNTLFPQVVCFRDLYKYW